MIDSWKIKNYVGGITSNIVVLTNNNSFIKQDPFGRDEDIDKYINTKEQIAFIKREKNHLLENQLKTLYYL